MVTNLLPVSKITSAGKLVRRAVQCILDAISCAVAIQKLVLHSGRGWPLQSMRCYGLTVASMLLAIDL